MNNWNLGATLTVNERVVYYNVGVYSKGSKHGRPKDSLLTGTAGLICWNMTTLVMPRLRQRRTWTIIVFDWNDVLAFAADGLTRNRNLDG
jgi:hypothetical protein